MKFFKKILFMMVISLLCSIMINNSFAQSDITQTILPMGFSPQGMAFVRISIQGKVIPIIFDTGFNKGTVALSPSALRGLKIKYINQRHCGSTVSGKMCEQLIRIPRVQLGNFTLHRLDGSVMTQLWGSKKGFIEFPASRNGLLGLKALRNFGVLIDYPHSQVILTKDNQIPKGYDISKWTPIPFSLKYGITTRSKINGMPFTLVWDTGPVFSVLKTNTRLKNKLVHCPANFPKIANCQALKTNRFTFNSHALTNTWFIVENQSLPFDGLLASNFFRQHLVFVDFKNRILFVKSAYK